MSDDNAVTQLDLFSRGSGASLDDRWETIRRTIQLAIEDIGLQEAAFALDMSPSQLSHAIAERDRSLPGRVIVYVVDKSPRYGDAVAGYFAALRGRELTEQRQMTPEEELRAYKESVAKNFGPVGADIVRRDALKK